jgi:hypothetical protein
MKMKTLVQGVVLSLMFVVSAFAADVTGKWKGESEGPNGQKRETAMTLEAKGSTVTGTVLGGRGGEATIEDGKIDGDNISFSVTRNMGGNDVKVQYKGKVTGDEIRFAVTAGDRNFDLLVKRVTT